MTSPAISETAWSHIYWLCVLHDTGSYTAAARRLGVSKAAVSQRISELEQRSGITLVQRTTRSVRLTEAGLAMVRTTQPAFTRIEEGFDSVRDLASVPQGILRMTAPVALGRQEILPVLGQFLKQYPKVRIELELSDHLSSLAQEGFDLAIRHTHAVPDNYVAWRLRTTRTWLVATPHYLAQQGHPRHPESLAQHNCLFYLRSGSSPVWSFTRHTDANERRSVAIRGGFSANNSEALRELVLQHLGIAMLPDFSANDWIARGELVRLMPDWDPVGVFGDGIYAIRPFSAYLPRAVRVLVDHLRLHVAPAMPQ